MQGPVLMETRRRRPPLAGNFLWMSEAARTAASGSEKAAMTASPMVLTTAPPCADTPIRLRASINTGPCIAVNLNSGIDYFGGTVNTAAKLQRCADAGEVALSQNVVSAPGVRETLAQLGGPVRPSELAHDALGLLPVAIWRPPA